MILKIDNCGECPCLFDGALIVGCNIDGEDISDRTKIRPKCPLLEMEYSGHDTGCYACGTAYGEASHE